MSTPQDPIGIGSEFERLFRSLLLSGDILGGDNPFSDSIVDRGRIDAVIDKGKRGALTCSLLTDKQGGATNVELCREYGLFGLSTELNQMLHSVQIDEARKGVLRREIRQADIFFRSVALDVGQPTFDDLWSSVTGSPAPSLSVFDAEIDALRDQLAFYLGLTTSTPLSRQGLKKAVVGWAGRQEHFGIDNETTIREMIESAKIDCLKAYRSLAQEVPGMSAYVDQLLVENFGVVIRPEMNFDAGMSYLGTVAGKLFSALFEWNGGRKAIAADIYYIAFHEFVHALNTALTELMVADGRIGAEGLLLTMSSGRAIIEEGMAQTLLEMSLGGTINGVASVHGANMAIVMILDQLQDLARLYAAIGWNKEFAHMPELVRLAHIRDLIENRLLQPENIGHKYASEKKKFWRLFPAGMMYAPAYWTGSRLFRKSIATHGVTKTFAYGTHFHGLMDGRRFQQELGL